MSIVTFALENFALQNFAFILKIQTSGSRKVAIRPVSDEKKAFQYSYSGENTICLVTGSHFFST